LADFSKLLAPANKFFPQAFPISGEAIHPVLPESFMRAPSVVAVIDDDSAVRTAIVALIASKGYLVEVYASAEEFIANVARSEAACLVIDVQLADLSGIELGRHLASLGYTFPMIFVTGADDHTLQKQAMALGCIAYLRKPVASDQLLGAIAEAVGQPTAYRAMKQM
jgi:FixJ family two-component response regulator